jgi:hypothetical protein
MTIISNVFSESHTNYYASINKFVIKILFLLKASNSLGFEVIMYTAFLLFVKGTPG